MIVETLFPFIVGTIISIGGIAAFSSLLIYKMLFAGGYQRYLDLQTPSETTKPKQSTATEESAESDDNPYLADFLRDFPHLGRPMSGTYSDELDKQAVEDATSVQSSVPDDAEYRLLLERAAQTMDMSGAYGELLQQLNDIKMNRSEEETELQVHMRDRMDEEIKLLRERADQALAEVRAYVDEIQRRAAATVEEPRNLGDKIREEFARLVVEAEALASVRELESIKQRIQELNLESSSPEKISHMLKLGISPLLVHNALARIKRMSSESSTEEETKEQ